MTNKLLNVFYVVMSNVYLGFGPTLSVDVCFPLALSVPWRYIHPQHEVD